MFDAKIALEMARLERIHNCPVWRTAKDELIPIVNMEASHLYSAWRYMMSAAKTPKNDRTYEIAITRLAMLQEEFKRRELSYPADDLVNLISKVQKQDSGWWIDRMDNDYDHD